MRSMKQQIPVKTTAELSGSAVDTNKFIAVETKLREILLQYLQAADFFKEKISAQTANPDSVFFLLLSLGSLPLSVSPSVCKTALLIQFRCSRAWRHEMLIPEFKWSVTIAILHKNKNKVLVRLGPPSMSSEGELRRFGSSMFRFGTDLPSCSCCNELGTAQFSTRAHTQRHTYRHRCTYNFLACSSKLLPRSIPGTHLNGCFIHINPVKRCRTSLFTSQIINYRFASLSHSSQIKESRCHQPSLV